ncbi:MAG: Tol-Pal system protein TolB [Verrucomicrobia bacterium]|nr:Tol-Pal system protein TolB [Verrucomicrobiota bacterium]
MLKALVSFFLVFSSLIWSEEIEVRLSTRTQLQPIYISQVKTEPSQFDWRYFDELRSILEFDLNTGGFCAILPQKPQWEEALRWPDPRKDFDLNFWKKQKVPFVVTLEVFKDRFNITAFQVEKGTSKKYPDFLLSGKLDEDRKQIHRLADTIHKDFFGQEGISSLRLIYSVRTRNTDPRGPEWHSEIWVCDADGANSRQITNEKSYCLSPGFLPKKQGSSDFYFVSYKGGQPKIYKASLHDPKPEPMVSLRGNQLLPSLSKKGSQLAFIGDAAGRPDLFIQNFDPNGRGVGKARQLFSAPRATQASPTFSPDGRQIAFVSDKDGPPRIYTLDVASPKDTKRVVPRLITKRNRENTSPSWSPDGKRLAYSAKVEGIRQIWLYDFETDSEVQLTHGPENKENPSWAPDNFHLVYNTESEDTCELYLINLQQQEPILLSKGSGQKRFASWETR